MDKTIEIEIKAEGLDQTIEKANQLVELLREAQHIVNSLSHDNKGYRYGKGESIENPLTKN